MRYYLETNALRALGKRISENQKLLNDSYTSLFSLFELAKGVGQKNDSNKRKNLLRVFSGVELPVVDFMPVELMTGAFFEEVNATESFIVSDMLSRILMPNNQDKNIDLNLDLVNEWNIINNSFIEMMNEKNCVPAPESEVIRIDIDSMFLDNYKTNESTTTDLPENWHPSDILIEKIRDSYSLSLFRTLFNKSDYGSLEDQLVLERYNGCLDFFFLAEFSYRFKRGCLREASSKNDLFDLLHTIYLFDTDKVMVSNDKLFEHIVPSRNLISVEEYMKRI